MHMADALLSPAAGAAVWAGSLAALGYSSRKLKKNLDGKTIPLMGVLGAFIFAAQMINFTIPGTGSSGHLGGGMILAIILGPYAGLIVMASVLTVQALFFADGGLLALGCNIWNIGFYPCFIAYPLIYRPIAGNGTNNRLVSLASIISVLIALQLGAFSVVLETLLSGKSELPFRSFVFFMQPIHLAIGIVEGIITAGIIGYVKKAKPDIIESSYISHPLDREGRLRNILISFLVLAVVTGGGLSWFASTHPDGLEWAIKKVTGNRELPEQQKGITAFLKGIQEKTAILPDYGFKQSGQKESMKENASHWPGIETGTSVSGILGGVIVLGVVLLIGFGIQAFKKHKAG